MTIVKLTAESNGAHANQTVSSPLRNIPAGWAVIPEEAEPTAKSFLPWVKLTVKKGAITAVEENAAAREAWEAEIAALKAAEEEAEENGN